MGGGVGGGVETIQVRRESTISSIMSVLYDDNTTAPCVLVIFLSNMSGMRDKYVEMQDRSMQP